jgi:transcription-repair coupling factor (superfamily II helicase)
MEIRGAGNLLGKNQSGHIELVGYELYSRILKEAVEELRRNRLGLPAKKSEVIEVDPEVRIGFPAHIPPWYVPDVAERLLLYQRLIELRDEKEGSDALEEIADRFGNPPEEVYILIELMVFRALLKRWGIVSANYRGGSLHLAFHPLAAPAVDKTIALVKSSGGRIRLTPSMSLNVKLEPEEISSPKALTEKAGEILRKLA